MPNKDTRDQQDKDFLLIFGSRLRVLRENAGLNRSNASKMINVSHSTLQAWEEGSGRMPNASNIRALAQAYKVNVQDFFSMDSNSEIKGKVVYDTVGNPVDIEEFVFIPRYNVQASAGHGADVSMENIMHPMAFRKYWIDNILGICAKSLIVIGVKGDSMEGEINNGDIILINKDDNALLNGIYVIRIEGDLIVKRIQRLPDGIIKVISANSAYESFEIDTNNPPLDFEAIGRVVWHGRNVH